MAKMKVVQVPKPGADLQLVDGEIPEPGPGHVRIRVQACGVCHSDVVRRKASFRECHILACPDTRWPALSTASARV